MSSDRRVITTFVSKDDTALIGDIIVPQGHILAVTTDGGYAHWRNPVVWVELECDSQSRPVYTIEDSRVQKITFLTGGTPYRASDVGNYLSTIVYSENIVLHAFVQVVTR